MKSDKRSPQQGGRDRPAGKARAVDPDQPFPQDPGDPSASDGKVDEAFEGKKYGEGNYEASRDYGKRVKDFVRSGDIEQAAEEAAPRDESEAQAMASAEQEGRSRSKGEDPSGSQSSGKKRPSTGG